MNKAVFVGILMLLVAACTSSLAAFEDKTGKAAPDNAAGSGITYYVDSIVGRDINPGISVAAAWKSLAKVNATVFAPGDRILFKSGAVWTGQLWPKGSGTENRPIIIDKYGDDGKPIIRCEGQAEDAVLLKNQQYWEIYNLEITNTGSGPATRRGVHIAGENAGDLHHIYVRSLIIHDVNGIDTVKENGGINYTAAGDSKPTRFVDLRIEDNLIYHVDRSGIFGWSTHWVRSKWYPGLGVVIRNNRLDDIGGDGVVNVATDGALVEYNIVRRANQRSEGYNVAIWPWSADNTVIQYNEAYETKGQRDGEGFDSDWNSRNTVIQYNYSHDNDGGFLLICNEGEHSSGENIGNTGTIVRYNVSRNDHTRGITVAGPVKDALIYNNTIYVGKNEKVNLLLHADWKGWADGVYLYNNIFYVDGSAQFSYGVSRADNGAYVTAPGFGQSRNTVFDYNLYYGNIKPGDDPHAITADPQFVNAGVVSTGRKTSTGYALQLRSPAIDSGKTITGQGGTDFLGTPIPSCGGTDRGAFESAGCGKD